MDNFKGLLTSSSKDLKNLHQQAGLTDDIVAFSASTVIKDKIDNCILQVEVKEEHDDLSQATLIGNVINTSMVKIEPEWNQFKLEHVPENTFIDSQDKPEYVQLIKIKSNKCILDISDETSGNALDGFKDFSGEQVEVLVKTENCESINDIGKRHEIALDDWKIKHEEVDIKDLKESEVSVSLDGTRQEKHDESKKHNCNACNFQTKRKSHLNTHILLHKNPEEVRTFKCDKCEFKTIHRYSLKIHLHRHENPEDGDLLKCNQCEYRTRRKGYLKTHILRHKNIEEVDAFKCNKCDYKTIEKGKLKTHQLRHEDPKEIKRFRCEKCDFSTIYKHSLKTHLFKHENREKMNLFKCDQCEYQTLWKCHLKTHILRHKNIDEVDAFKCNKCDYKTIDRGALKRHYLKHKDPQEIIMFSCDQCDFKTIHKDNLKKHVQRHENS